MNVYAIVLFLVTMIALYIAYNPVCLSKYGIENMTKDGDIGEYELPY